MVATTKLPVWPVCAEGVFFFLLVTWTNHTCYDFTIPGMNNYHMDTYRVAKCKFLDTDQIFQTKFYPNKSTYIATNLILALKI